MFVIGHVRKHRRTPLCENAWHQGQWLISNQFHFVQQLDRSHFSPRYCGSSVLPTSNRQRFVCFYFLSLRLNSTAIQLRLHSRIRIRVTNVAERFWLWLRRRRRIRRSICSTCPRCNPPAFSSTLSYQVFFSEPLLNLHHAWISSSTCAASKVLQRSMYKKKTKTKLHCFFLTIEVNTPLMVMLNYH